MQRPGTIRAHREFDKLHGRSAEAIAATVRYASSEIFERTLFAAEDDRSRQHQLFQGTSAAVRIEEVKVEVPAADDPGFHDPPQNNLELKQSAEQFFNLVGNSFESRSSRFLRPRRLEFTDVTNSTLYVGDLKENSDQNSTFITFENWLLRIYGLIEKKEEEVNLLRDNQLMTLALRVKAQIASKIAELTTIKRECWLKAQYKSEFRRLNIPGTGGVAFVEVGKGTARFSRFHGALK